MTNFLNLLAGGLLAGSVVGLMALGLSLIYRTSGTLNLSQGSLAALGGYVCYAASSRMPMIAAVFLAVIISAAVAAVIGILIDLRLRRHSDVIAMVATLGVGIVLAQILEQIWGSSAIMPNTIGFLPVRVAGLTLDRVDLWAAVAAAALAGVLTVFLKWTRLGVAIRAVADSVDGARISGIPAARMRALCWAIAGGLAAVSGFFVATTVSPLSSNFMDIYMVAALLAAVIGGIGSLSGAVAGALLVSVAQSLFGNYAPTWTFGSKTIFVGTFTQTFVFLVLIAVLLMLPRGLLGGRAGRRV